MSSQTPDVALPVKRTDGETIEDRLTANAYHNILPARYLKKDQNGDLAEDQEDLFERVAKNIALAEAVFEARERDVEVTVTPDQVKPDHPRRDELAAEVFGAGTTADDDAETTLDEHNVNKFAYDTIVPELPEGIREHVVEKREQFQDVMEQLAFIPNSPTLMNAGDELQQLSACFVDSPGDDLTDIHQTAKEAAEIFQSGGGMGYAFWKLRPYGDPVGSTGGIASGPITFMETYDQLCFPPGTRVLTPEGQVPIEDLEEGDLVVDAEGNERPVTETMERTVDEEIVEITPKRLNRPVRATGEHPFRVAREDGFEWVDADDIETGDMLVLGSAAAERGPGLDDTIDLSTVASGPLVFTDGGIRVNQDYHGTSKGRVPSSIADEVPMADLATLAGWYLAEGCVVYRRGMPNEVTFTLHIEETGAAAEIEAALESFGIPARIEHVEDRTTRIVHAESASFAQFVEGLFGTGAAEKTVPEFLWSAPVDVQARLLEALFDGDGRLQHRGKSQRIQLKLANEEIVDFVFQVGLRCGVQFSRHDRTPDDRKETFSVSASVSTAIDTPLERLFDDIPDDFRAVDRTKQAHGREVVEVDSVTTTHHEGPVHNVEVPGSHSYVAEDLVVHNCETIAQGGARRGAQMGVMRVSHPDVVEFIHAKNKDVSLAHSLRLNDPDDYTYTTFKEALEEARELIDDDGRVPEHLRNAVEGHLSNFNISVGVTDGFMEALKAGEEYTFTNPRTGEPHVATAETKEMYERYGLGEYVEPGEELSVPAEVIWDRIVEGAHENGEPGVIYLERVNKEHSFDVEEHPDHRILATNPSLGPGTKVLTDQGVRDIEELEGKRVEVPTLGGEWADAICHQSGNDEPLYEVELSNGKTYRATEEHKWPVRQEDGTYERTRTTAIERGDHLPIRHRRSLQYGSVGDYDDGFLVGWLYGDGSITDRKDGRTQYGFTFSEEDSAAGVMDRVLTTLEDITGVEYDPSQRQRDGEPWYEVHASHAALRRRMDEFGVDKKTEGIPDVVWSDASESFRKGLIDGLFSADGFVDSDQNRIVLVSSKEELIKDVSDLLGFYGLKTSLRNSDTESWGKTYDRWDLKLSRTAAHRFRETFHLTHEGKSAALADLKTPDRDNVLSDNVVVEQVNETGESGPVWDLRVGEETHTFALSHAFTGNCGEQPLEEYEACNLGHINLSTLAAEDGPDWRQFRAEHDDLPLEEAVERFIDEAIDVEELERRIELGTRFLENVVTMSDFPVPEIERTVREMRKVGLGIMGLAQLYIQLGLKYGSEPSNEVARQLMRRINHGSKWTSHELAGARGSFEEWENSKYADPTRYPEWFERQTGLDPEDYAEDGFKIRNHNTTTIAPTGTTSMVGNTSGGCEPIFNVAYYKNVSDDVQGEEMLVEFDDYFLRTLEANGIDVDAVKEEAKEQMAANEFDGVDGLETVPDAIGELFVTTGDLSAKEHAAVQCALQEGVDSAISKCLEKGTLVQTDSGVRPIESFADETPEPGEFVDIEEDVTIDGVPVESQYYAGEKDATRIRVDNGTELVGATESHKVLTPEGWRVLGDLEEGDHVIGRHAESHGEDGTEVSFTRGSEVATDGGAALATGGADFSVYEKDVTLPSRMTPRLARFLGMYAADGSAIDARYSIEISTSAERVRDEACELFEELFGREPSVEADTRGGEQRDTVYGVSLNSKPVWEFVTDLCGSGSYGKEVPSEVFRGSPEEKLAFVNGVTLDGYVSSQSLVVYGGMSNDLAVGVAELLRSFGVPKVYVGRRWVDESDAYSYQVHVTNDAQELVTPIEPHKRVERFDQRQRVYVPQDRVDKTEFDSRSREYYAARNFEHRDRNYMFDETAESLGISDAPPLYEVTDVEDVGTREMYDIELAGPHEYVVGGIVSHNTVNAPNDSTADDAKEVFEYIYDHGGKGVTYYRDGTRSKQVLTTRADNTDFADMDEEEAVEAILENIEELFGGIDGFLEQEDVRERLDAGVTEIVVEGAGADGDVGLGAEGGTGFAEKKPRPDVLKGVTQRIDTGYGKLYLTINEDAETGQPFELFANTGMSGGFTASFTEALAKSISVALRSGVDPYEIADKLEGIRSPKVAWDKGEQINSIPDAFGVGLRRYLDDEIDKPYPKQQNLTELADAEDTESDDGRELEPDPEPEVVGRETETDGGATAAESASTRGETDTESVLQAGESPECPECGSMTLYYSEGCKTCESCGWSEC